MHRFMIAHSTAFPGARVPLSSEEAAHALRVLRLKEGTSIQLSDGQGSLWTGTLAIRPDGGCDAILGEACPDHEPPVRVTLYQGFPKLDKLDYIVQKATELGVAKVVPVLTARSVVKLDAKDAEKRAERLTRIAKEATKQCGRATTPVIVPPMPFSRALTALAAHETLIFPWESADSESTRIRDLYPTNPNCTDIAVVIGPEGGIESAEAEALRACGAHIVTLGPRILRSDTAAVTAISIIMNLWGDL